MFNTSQNSASQITSGQPIRDLYQAREYGAVVGMLKHLPREQLLADPESAFMFADSARRVGGIDDVHELVTQVVTAARNGGPSNLLCDAINLQGIMLLQRGEAHAAERAWFELVSIATETDNSQYVARASNNLGVAAILSMRLEEAITSFQRSVGAYLRLGYSRGLAQSHQNLGIVYREMDRSDESHAHFERAISWAYAADSLDDVARAELEIALLLVYSPYRDLPNARRNAQRALDRFTEIVHPGDVAEALRVMGVITIAEGDLQEAEHQLNAALEGARIHKRRLLEAETLTALSAITAMPKSFALEKQAREIYGAMDAEPWGDQVRRRMQEIKT